MANQVTTWLLAIPLLGLVTGMRTMTAIAVVSWFAHLNLLPVHATWAFWLANPISVAVFSLAALAEYVVDMLPQTGPRTAPAGLLSRGVFAGLVGAAVAASLQNSIPVAVVLAVIGAVLGAFGGYLARVGIVRNFRCRDWPVGLLEDFVAILLAVFSMRMITAW